MKRVDVICVGSRQDNSSGGREESSSQKSQPQQGKNQLMKRGDPGSTLSKGKHSKVYSEGTNRLRNTGKTRREDRKLRLDNQKSDVSSVNPGRDKAESIINNNAQYERNFYNQV